MVGLEARQEQFIKGLTERAGMDESLAKEQFLEGSSKCEIGNEIDFVLDQTKHLSQVYPKIKIAPLLYKVEDHQIYWIENVQ